jgi:tripartite-type tricarboxylate transporter receptor subunit TctC
VVADPQGREYQGRMNPARRLAFQERNMMKLPRRNFLHLAAGAAALPAASRIARAQAYPTRPVRIVVGFAAGTGADIIARLMGQWLAERLGQSVIIENRAGAGTNIATEAVVRSPPDGHTLLAVTPANAINATLYDKLNFNFLRDIAPVGGVMRTPNVMVVNSAVPATSVPEFIAYAKARPGQLSMASAGNGTSKSTPPEIIDRINREINAGLADPNFKARIAGFGGMALVGSPADFGKLMAEETEKWGKVVKFAGLKPE